MRISWLSVTTMLQDPFGPEVPIAQRIAVTAGMGIAGLFGTRQLKLPWPVAVIASIVGCALLAFLAWRSPQLFFKNRR